VTELDAAIVLIAEALAKKAGRWDHASKVVALLGMVPGVRDVGTSLFLLVLGWLHDILEHDVTQEDLKEAGIPPHVIVGIRLLNRKPRMTLDTHYRALDGAPELVKIVRVVDQVVHVREQTANGSKRSRGRCRQESEHYAVALIIDMGEPWRGWLLKRLRSSVQDLKIAGRRAKHRKRHPSRKQWLLEVHWASVLAEHLYYRVPKSVMMTEGVPDLITYEHLADEYLASFPSSVTNAIEGSVAKWADRADIDDVLERLVPPLLFWARTEKGMELDDHEGALYPTRWRAPEPDD
jgi:hypothetical protein